VLVNIKLVGAYAVVNLLWLSGRPIPTLSGLGIISSVVSDGLPEPNWICRFVLSKNLVANLFWTDLILNKFV
jgi:hypothetical protein